jgi:hypothetical protein
MTEHPPSAGALHVAETFVDTRERWHKLAGRIDSLCEQRVSAERERLARMWFSEQGEGYIKVMLGEANYAPAERSAPEGPQPTSALGIPIIADSSLPPDTAEMRSGNSVVRITNLDSSVPSALVSTGEQPASPAAVVDYTEQALTVARDAIEGVPSHLLPYRINSEEIAQTIAPDIAAALSAVASERDAAAIRAFGQRVWDTEEVAYQAGVSDTRARLQEPYMREAVRVAIASVSDYGNAYVQNLNRADAALTRIAEMLK